MARLGGGGSGGGSGDNGDRAGLIYQFATATGTADTTAGHFKIDNVNPAAATVVMRIDIVDAAGINMESVIDTWAIGDNLAIYSNASPASSSFLRFTISVAPVLEAPGGRWVMTLINGSGTIFAEDEECAIQHSVAGAAGGPGGDKGGFRYDVDTSTPTTPNLANVTTGKIRFNHATIGSVTAISIYKTSADSQNLAAFLATWQVGGRVRLLANTVGGGIPFMLFDITTSIVDSTNYITLTGAVIASSAFTNGDEVVLDYFDSAEAPTYTSLDDTSLPAAASNTNLIVSLTEPLALSAQARRALYISNGVSYIGLGRVVVDSYGADIGGTISPAGTWVVSNNAGKVRLTLAAHGVGAGVVGASFYVKTTGNGWTAGELVTITGHNAGYLDTNTDYNTGTPQTTPTFALTTDRIILAAVPIPPLQANSRIEIDATWLTTGGGVSNKTISIELCTTATGVGTALWTPATQTANAITRTPVGIVNKNDTGSQRSRYGLTNLTGMNTTAAGSMATSAIETNVTTYLLFVATSVAITDTVALAQRHVEVIY